MSGFETLLNKAKEAELITEEEASNMLNDYNAAEEEKVNNAVNDAVSAAEGTAFRQGYEEGFNNGKQQAAAEAKKASDALIEELDEEATNKFKSVVEILKADYEEKIENLKKANDEKLDSTVDDKLAEQDADHSDKLNEIYDLLTREKEEALKQMDEEHAEMLEQIHEAIKNNYVKKTVVEQMDADHARKMKMLMEAKDAADAEKLLEAVQVVKEAGVKKALVTEAKVRKEMENELKKHALKNDAKISVLAESVDKYLNYALQTAIPTKTLISEAKYNASKKALDKIISILKINNVIQESKDGIFQEFENKIKDAKDETNRVLAENVELKNELSKKEAKLLLESKLVNCTPDEAKYLRRYFSTATSPKMIEENIEDARSEYHQIIEERRQKLVLENEKKGNASSTAGKKIVSESIKNHGSMNESLNKKPSAPAMKTVEKPQEKHENSQQSVYDIYADILKNNL